MAAPAAPATATAMADSPAQGDQQASPEQRQKRWAELNKRIDAGEFGEEIKKLPEDQRRQRMMEMRRKQPAADAGNASNANAK